MPGRDQCPGNHEAVTNTMTHPSRKDAQVFARRHLGIGRLRPGQEAAILAVLEGRNTLAIMPTGSGKSAIYQVAGGLMERLVLVISPLIALQQDQVERLRPIDPEWAAMLNSSLTDAERGDVLERVRSGDLTFLFLAPEQLDNDETFQILARGKPALVVVDEAHCVSDWGHDFRPDYLHLGDRISALGGPTILALTATATPNVQREIIERLAMRDPEVLVHDFDRPNIHLSVQRFTGDDEKLVAVLDEITGSDLPGIVYAATRNATEEIADALAERGIEARAYHAGLKGSDREAIQNAFMNDDIHVIVATIAFGMGIDKRNVRFVYHYDVSSSLDSYYQEIGRAGRDACPARATLFYAPEDIEQRRFQSGAGQLVPDEVEPVVRELRRKRKPTDPTELKAAHELTDTKLNRVIDRLDDIEAISLHTDGQVELTARTEDPEELAQRAADAQGTLRQYEHSRLEMMRQYTDLETCRRAFLLRYFNQDAPARCEACDNCRSGRTAQAQVRSQVFPDNADVTHAEWGDGKVLHNDDDTVTVRFDSVGYKTLAVDIVQRDNLLTLRETAPASQGG
jgi:ATP-dependent DNA helicase RecQ